MPQDNEKPQPSVQPPAPPPGPAFEPPTAPAAETAHLTKVSVGDAVQGAWQAGWGLLKSDTVALLLGGILAAFLSGITLGILAGAMAWGFYAMCFQRLRRGEPMKIDTVFSQFQRFGTSLGTALLTFAAVVVGLALLVVPGLYAAVVFMYALPIAWDEQVGAWEALRRSRERVHTSGFWPHAVLLATLVLVGGVFSRIFMGALNLPWYAFAMAVIASAYEMYVRPHAAPLPPH